eukprot:3453917-Amphidinium_carterae.1
MTLCVPRARQAIVVRTSNKSIARSRLFQFWSCGVSPDVQSVHMPLNVHDLSRASLSIHGALCNSLAPIEFMHSALQY